MNYTITSGQIGFFKKYGYLAVEGLFSVSEKEEIEKNIPILSKKRKDLWRESPFLLQFVQKKKLLQIASLLVKKPLRLLYDQLLVSGEEKPVSETKSLQEKSCYREILLGLLVKLKAAVPSEEEEKDLKNASLIFLQGNSPFPFHSLLEEKDQAYYLVCYGNRRAMFVENQLDPFSSQLKNQGYSFGDLLKEETHPMVFWER